MEKDREMPTGEILIYGVLKHVQNKICGFSLPSLGLILSGFIIALMQNYYLKTCS